MIETREGLLMSNDELLAHLLETESVRMQLAERLPFFPVGGGTPVDAIAAELAPTDTLKLLVQDIQVNDYVAYNQSNVNSQVGVQLEAATRRLLRRFWKSFGTGSGGVEIAGLDTFARTIEANEEHLTLIDLARLVAMVTANNGRPHVFWTNPAGVKNIQRAYFEKGLEPEYVMVNVPDSNGGWTQRPTLAFQGIPIYADEQYPVVDGKTSIYAMVLGRGGVYGVVPASFGTRMIRVKEVLNSTDARTVYRVYWPVGLVCEKPEALARLTFTVHPTTE